MTEKTKNITCIQRGVFMHEDDRILEYHFHELKIGKDKEFILEAIHLLEFVESKKPLYLLINASMSEYLYNPTLIKWMENVVYHHLFRAGILKIAIVVNEEIMQQTNQYIEANKIKQAIFLKQEIAIRWLQKKSAIKLFNYEN